MLIFNKYPLYIPLLSMLSTAQSYSFYENIDPFTWFKSEYFEPQEANPISTQETETEFVIHISSATTNQQEQAAISAYSSEDYKTLYIKGAGTYITIHKSPQSYPAHTLSIEYKKEKSYTDSSSEETKKQHSSHSVHIQKQSQLIFSDIVLEKAVSRYNKTNNTLTVIIPKTEPTKKNMIQIPITIEE